MKVKDAEIQFTSDITIPSPVNFEIWLDHPQAGWTKVFDRSYKSIKDIINVAREGKGVIPRVDNLRHDVLVFPIRYDKKITLSEIPAMEVRCYTVGDIPLTGEWATITFYTEVET